MRRLACQLSLAVCCLAAGATGVSAQTTSGTVPGDVMAVLLQGPDVVSGRPFDLRVGTAPQDFPRDLLPAGTRVQASAIAPRTTTVVGTLAQYAATDQPAFESALGSAGWIEMQSRPRGFNAIVQGVPLTLCRGAQFATVSFAPRDAGGMFVRASVSTDPTRACSAPHAPDYGDVPLPPLHPPADTTSSSAAIGGTPDATYSTVRLRTSRSVDAIAADYTGQLTAAGWRMEGQARESDTMTITRFSTTSVSGDPMSGYLVVTALGGNGDLDVLLRVVRRRTGTR